MNSVIHQNQPTQGLLQKWNEMKEQNELTLFRMERGVLLKESDVYVLPDFPHKTPEIKKHVCYIDKH